MGIFVIMYVHKYIYYTYPFVLMDEYMYIYICHMDVYI